MTKVITGNGKIKNYINAIKQAHEINSRAKSGEIVSLEPVKHMRGFNIPLYNWTLESRLFATNSQAPRLTRGAMREAFNSFDSATQTQLTFTPDNNHTWIWRISLYKYALKDLIPPKECRRATIKMLEWAIHCKKQQ